MSDVYRNMAENVDADVIAYINVTNPLIKDVTIIEAIEKYKEIIANGNFDSLNSAHLIKEFMFVDNKPINYDLKNQPRSQDLPDIAALNFAVSIVSKEKMISCKNVVGDKPYIHCSFHSVNLVSSSARVFHGIYSFLRRHGSFLL